MLGGGGLKSPRPMLGCSTIEVYLYLPTNALCLIKYNHKIVTLECSRIQFTTSHQPQHSHTTGTWSNLDTCPIDG
jgi:hypothetical protein